MLPISENLAFALQKGLTIRAVELVLEGFARLGDRNKFIRLHENSITAALRGKIIKQCPQYGRKTKQVWEVVREYYNDDELIESGERDANSAPRIDIVITTWTPDFEPIRFPFECKLLADNSTLIRLYVRKGIQERYLQKDKDYSNNSNWGAMIGYVIQGNHASIAPKINKQIRKQLRTKEELLLNGCSDSVARYLSIHKRDWIDRQIEVIHLFLSLIE